ncbi:DUF1654 domain-containing protein [Pseudomonas sp. RC10]|uniref:DUF1654 domain-containing protein n=1 Tax=Pseudomonas bambusae TaxID=3139142 RepID=UPI003139B862
MSATSRKPATNPYQSLVNRIQRAIMAPAAQLERTVCLYRSPDEDEGLWDQLIDEMSEADSVRTERLEDGGVRVTWDPPTDD